MYFSEKRRMERFDLKLPASMSSNKRNQTESFGEYQTKDICAVGAFFKTNKPLDIGAEVKINLLLPFDELKKIEGKKTLIKLSGEVIRTDSEGMAVCFNESYEILPIKKNKLGSTASFKKDRQ